MPSLGSAVPVAAATGQRTTSTAGAAGTADPAGEDDLTQTAPAACPQPLHGHSQIVVLGRKVGLCASGRGAGGWWGRGESERCGEVKLRHSRGHLDTLAKERELRRRLNIVAVGHEMEL